MIDVNIALYLKQLDTINKDRTNSIILSTQKSWLKSPDLFVKTYKIIWKETLVKLELKLYQSYHTINIDYKNMFYNNYTKNHTYI